MTSEHIEQVFPTLRVNAYSITSGKDVGYNCIAWAVRDPNRWWWPHCDAFWPSTSPLEWSLEAFRIAFAELGYEESINAEVEPGVEKVALFVDHDGLPTHAARQLPSGRWTSKLGKEEDIEHELKALEGRRYGVVALVLARHGSDVYPTER